MTNLQKIDFMQTSFVTAMDETFESEGENSNWQGLSEAFLSLTGSNLVLLYDKIVELQKQKS